MCLPTHPPPCSGTSPPLALGPGEQPWVVTGSPEAPTWADPMELPARTAAGAAGPPDLLAEPALTRQARAVAEFLLIEAKMLTLTFK